MARNRQGSSSAEPKPATREGKPSTSCAMQGEGETRTCPRPCNGGDAGHCRGAEVRRPAPCPLGAGRLPVLQADCRA